MGFSEKNSFCGTGTYIKLLTKQITPMKIDLANENRIGQWKQIRPVPHWQTKQTNLSWARGFRKKIVFVALGRTSNCLQNRLHQGKFIWPTKIELAGENRFGQSHIDKQNKQTFLERGVFGKNSFCGIGTYIKSLTQQITPMKIYLANENRIGQWKQIRPVPHWQTKQTNLSWARGFRKKIVFVALGRTSNC